MLVIIDVKNFFEMDVENLKYSCKYFYILIYFMVVFIKKNFYWLNFKIYRKDGIV